MNQKRLPALTLISLLVAASFVPSTKAMDMMMPMYFWTGWEDGEIYWLSRHLKTTSSGEYAAGLIVTFLLGLVIQCLSWMRNFIYIKSQISAIRATEALNR